MKHSEQMQKLVKNADTNNDGVVTLDEFKRIIGDKQMRTWMSALEVDVGDPEGLFALIDTDGDGGLTYEQISASLSRLKGSARSIDLIALKHDMANLEDMLQDLCGKVDGCVLFQNRC